MRRGLISGASGGSAGAAGLVQISGGAGNPLAAATNVVAGSNYVSAGASPSTSGTGFRVPLGGGLYALSSIATDIPVAHLDSSNRATLGDPAGGYMRLGTISGDGTLTCLGTFTYIVAAAQTHDFYVSGANKLSIGAVLAAAGPIIGSASPYGVHGTFVSAMTDAAYTVPASEYIYKQIEVPASLTLTATRAFRLPTPATDAASYDIEIYNLTTGGQTLTLSRADGAGVTVALLTTQRAHVRVRPAGVYLISAAL